MNELAVKNEEILVNPIQRVTLSKSIDQMERIHMLNQIALRVVSDSHKFTILKLSETLANAKQLLNLYEIDADPNVAEAYEWLTSRYLELMKSIMRIYDVRIMAEVERASQDSGDVSLVMWARVWLGL